jgi:hypothetical protein
VNQQISAVALVVDSYDEAFEEEPRAEEYGTVAVFLDLYGNRWDLLQLNP